MHFTINRHLCVGICLLVAIPVWLLVAVPKLESLPSDFHFAADIVSTDDFYNVEKGDYTGALYSKTNFYYETVSQTGSALIVRNVFDVRTPDDKPIFAVERLYGIDRKTGVHVAGLGDKSRAGYLFAPRHLKADESFTYWHINYDGPAQMKFAGEEQLYGLSVFRYETHYEGVDIDQTKNLGFLPGVGKARGIRLEPYLQLWVEPLTGRLIKFKDDTVAYYYDLKTKERLHPWNHFSNTFDERSVEQNVAIARFERTKAKTIELYIPALLFLLGLFFLGSALGLIARLIRHATLKNISTLVGLLIIATACTSFVGWIVGSEILIRIIPHGNAMNPLTALCFMVLGSSILLREKAHGRIGAVLGGTLMLIGIMRIAGVMGIIDFQVDLLLFSDAMASARLPARMAIYTANSFLLLGALLVTAVFPSFKKLHLDEILPTIVVLFSLVVIVSFLFDAAHLLSLPIFFSAAIHTAVLFLCAAVTMYGLFRDRAQSLAFGGWLATSGVLLVSVLLTVSFTGLVERSFSQEARALFTTDVDRLTTAISERLSIYINMLQSGKGLFASSQNVARDEWESYVEALRIRENYPGIQGMSYVVVVSPEERENHIATIRAEGFPTYTIYPSGQREVYTSILYIEPFDKQNQRALGFDMFQEPVRRLAMEQARDTGEPRMSGRVTLVQDEDAQSGFIIYVPIYENGKPHETVDERRKSIVGYVSAPFRAGDFVEGIFGKDGLSHIALRIHDGVVVAPENALYDDARRTMSGTASAEPRFVSTKTFYIAGRPWTLTFTSESQFGENAFSRYAPFVVLFTGIIVSILVSLLFHTLLASRQKALSYADELTKDLQREKARDEAMLLSIGDGLIATDKDGNIVLTNPTFEDLLGYKGPEVRGKTLWDVIPMLDENEQPIKALERPVYKALKASTTTTTTTIHYYLRKDGTKFPTKVTVTPIRLDDHVIGAITVFRDVTKELALDKRQREFVSLASHQIRTPVTAMRLAVELLGKGRFGPVNKEQEEVLKGAMGYAVSLAETVHTMLSVSRSEAGTTVIDVSEIMLKDLFEELRQEHAFWYSKKNLVLDITCPDGLVVRSDKALLKEIVANLFSNGIRYTPDNGKVGLHAAKEGETIRIEVVDTGMGIPKEAQGKIFQKFFRADNARNKITDGTGLGLYLVRSLVELIGARVEFVSEENKGTTFSLFLPTTPPANGA